MKNKKMLPWQPQCPHQYKNVIIDSLAYENMGIDTKIMFLSLVEPKT